MMIPAPFFSLLILLLFVVGCVTPAKNAGGSSGAAQQVFCPSKFGTGYEVEFEAKKTPIVGTKLFDLSFKTFRCVKKTASGPRDCSRGSAFTKGVCRSSDDYQNRELCKTGEYQQIWGKENSEFCKH